MQFKNLSSLRKALHEHSDLQSEFMQDPLVFLDKLEEPKPPIWNKGVFLTVVYIVGFALIGSIVVAAVTVLGEPDTITGTDGVVRTQAREIDQFFVMIASAAIGALAGLLVPAQIINSDS